MGVKNGRPRRTAPSGPSNPTAATDMVPVRAADIETVIDFLETDVFWAAFTDRGLAALSFAEPDPLFCVPSSRSPLNRVQLLRIDLRKMLADGRTEPWGGLLVRETVRFLKTGRHRLPLDFSGCTPFQQRVFEAVAGIGPGRLCTYKHVAMMIGQPLAARAVGNALAQEPFDYFLPAHRVVPQGGFGLIRDGSANGRLRLLAREGHDVETLGK